MVGMHVFGFVKLPIFIFINTFFICLVNAEEKTIPFKTESYANDNIISRIVIVFLIVSLIAYGMVVLIKRYFNGGLLKNIGDGDIRLLKMKRVSPQLTIIKILIDNMEVTLAQSTNGLLKINEKEFKKTDDPIKLEKTD